MGANARKLCGCVGSVWAKLMLHRWVQCWAGRMMCRQGMVLGTRLEKTCAAALCGLCHVLTHDLQFQALYAEEASLCAAAAGCRPNLVTPDCLERQCTLIVTSTVEITCALLFDATGASWGMEGSASHQMASLLMTWRPWATVAARAKPLSAACTSWAELRCSAPWQEGMCISWSVAARLLHACWQVLVGMSNLEST